MAGTSSPDGHLRLTQIRSAIGTKPKHRGTLRALGLRGIGRTRVLPNVPEIRGMIARVPHLIEVVPATADEAASQGDQQQATRRSRRAAERRDSE
jgi:large subunit ribosomal protein L30